jgi:hypothetical protein
MLQVRRKLLGIHSLYVGLLSYGPRIFVAILPLSNDDFRLMSAIVLYSPSFSS